MCLSLGLACLGKDWAHYDRKVVQDGAALPQSVFGMPQRQIRCIYAASIMYLHCICIGKHAPSPVMQRDIALAPFRRLG